jgi:hypothetical protein
MLNEPSDVYVNGRRFDEGIDWRLHGILQQLGGVFEGMEAGGERSSETFRGLETLAS